MCRRIRNTFQSFFSSDVNNNLSKGFIFIYTRRTSMSSFVTNEDDAYHDNDNDNNNNNIDYNNNNIITITIINTATTTRI